MNINNTNIVVTYDYYTLEQARDIIYAEMAADRERINKMIADKRKRKISKLKFVFGMFATVVLPPALMVIHWLVMGY